MADIVTRKCACCKGVVEIDKRNISNVICFQGKYYHYDCFIILASEKAATKRGKPQMWQEALDNIWALEAETKKMLEQFIARDELNIWLLENYNITSVPTRFWQIIADLEGGMYKGKRCKPVDVTTLCGCWKWGQKRLNQIALTNKSNRKGPSNDSDRLRYDLAILINHTEDFKKHQNKIKAMEIERQIASKENININYNKIKTANNSNGGLDDISDLLEELI